jgi:hypothetical protein
MFVENPFLSMENPGRSNESVRSSIVNGICPECGGALSLATEQFRCQGRCGTDWRPVWNRARQLDRSPDHRAKLGSATNRPQ